ncbi:MAG: methyltransferase domain-containing protein [Candidatus Pacebacteria bacterium]|nr:methyltransferase domain-containing protein [Candidatus Paceibacterota bacterium]
MSRLDQQIFWDNEYKDPQLVTKSFIPQSDVTSFLSWVRRKQKYPIDVDATILDIGCGVGRHCIYIADQYGAQCFGFDFSATAIALGNAYIQEHAVSGVHLTVQSLTDKIPLQDNSVDIVIDAMSSHSLLQSERVFLLSELYRVLKPGGFLFVRTFLKDGDANAKELLKRFPGPEKDTYKHPRLHVVERVFEEKDFKQMYGNYFSVVSFDKKTGYQKWDNQSYKRRYLIAHMQKKS